MRAPHPQHLKHPQAGLSLIEMMIAMTISLFLLVGLAGIFANSSRTQNELTKTARQIEDGRFAIGILADDLALAGYYGYYYITSTPAVGVDPCVTAIGSLASGLNLPVQGYDRPVSATDAARPGCVTAADHLSGTDILVVRRADTKATAVGSLAANDVYLQHNSDTTASPVLAAGSSGAFTQTVKSGALAPIRKYHVHIYYIAPCSVPAGAAANTNAPCTGATDDGGSPIPTLKRMELSLDPLSGNLAMVIVPLVEGVENMQIDYGLDGDGDGTAEGAWVKGLLTTDAAEVAKWANVVSVRVTLLVRNVEITGGYTDTKTYNLGLDGNVTPGGAYKRHVYQTVVRLINPSSRRETP